MYGVANKEPTRQYATNCLLARRMVERGVRFVNLITLPGTTTATSIRELNINSDMTDQPVAALIKDLKQRGLLDSTLVIWSRRFGRTPLGEIRNPRTRRRGPRSPSFRLQLWMAGGGVKGGQVIGKSDEFGWGIARRPVHINDLHATILHCLGLDHLG